MNEIRQLDDEEELLSVGASTVLPESRDITLENAMPKGFDTPVGEKGRGLSGGQKQRLLIARALYRDPQYLFLDEATNALDTVNERLIVDALNSVFKERTVVVIAHRLSTIRNADQIVVMHEGTIVEIGNHETLMERKGAYYQLIASQTDTGNTRTPVTDYATSESTL